jgi:hypothetical protein
MKKKVGEAHLYEELKRLKKENARLKDLPAGRQGSGRD